MQGLSEIENHLKRRLLPNEYVHHVNGNPNCNNLENLEVREIDSNIRIYTPLCFDKEDAISLRLKGFTLDDIKKYFKIKKLTNPSLI